MPVPLDDETLGFLGAELAHVRTLEKQLLEPETGLCGSPTFLRFLEIEFYRFEAYFIPFTLVLFEMRTVSGGEIPPEAIATAALRISLVIRKLDIVGHFDANTYAILLPGTRLAEGVLIAGKILKALTASSLAPGMNKNTLKISFGVAGLPDNGNDLKSLVVAAQTARQQALEKNFPVNAFRGVPEAKL
jgi:diguanylate cyclase (GGDEF)-like protein